jgi:hypothetical protein
MITKRNYQRCGLNGVGKAHRIKDGKTVDFSIIEISASGFKIEVDTNFDDDEIVEVELRFSGLITVMEVKAKATIVRKEPGQQDNTYSLRFEGLSDKEKVEIDEIITFSCIEAKLTNA